MIRRFPSIFLLIFIVSGIVLADQSRISSWVFLLVCLPFCLGGLIAMSVQKTFLATVAFGLSLLAFCAFHFAIRYYEIGPRHVLSVAAGSERCHIFGRVTDWPDLKPDRTEFKIEIDSIPDNRVTSVSGAILLRVSDTTTALQRGDRVEFYGRIYPVRSGVSASGFNYGRHLNMKGVFGIVYVPTLLDIRIDRRNRYAILTLIDDLRDDIRRVLYTDLSPTPAALASGFLIGETRDIPTEVYYRFRDSGTLHLLAVSGSNVALIVLFFVFLLRPLGLKATKRAIVLLAVIAAFTLLSYGEPSVVRASVMASLVIVAGMLQRRHDLNNIIAAAAVIILLFDPAQLFDIGFQLSFVIAWGLIFILPRVTDFFQQVHNRWWYRWLVFPFLVSVVAQICSVGLIAFYFQRIPVISPFANLLVVPMVSIGVIGILAVIFAHLALPLLGLFVGAWLNLLLESVLEVVMVLGSENMPALRLSDVSLWWVLLFYVFLFLTIWSLRKIRLRRLVVISLVVTVNAILLTNILVADTSIGAAKVTVFNVPGGACAVVQTPGRKGADLIITGMNCRRYPVAERIIQPQLSRLGVDSLNDIFVLSAEFDAIADLMYLADSCAAQRVLVKKSLKRSFLDALTINPAKRSGCKLETLVEVAEPDNLSAFSYRLTSRGLILAANGSGIIFCDRISPGLLQPSPASADFCLVVGSSWRADEADLWRVMGCGFQQIVCSKIAHEEDSAGRDSGLPALPDGLSDLSLRGPITLNL